MPKLLNATKGTYNFYCKVCGRVVKANTLVQNWDGRYMCPGDIDRTPERPRKPKPPRRIPPGEMTGDEVLNFGTTHGDRDFPQ